MSETTSAIGEGFEGTVVNEPLEESVSPRDAKIREDQANLARVTLANRKSVANNLKQRA